MKQINKIVTECPGRNIMQKRSKKTYDALIKTGFRLLKKREWDSITVAEISRSAGYSVGAFYTRFRSKEELLDALADHHRKARKAAIDHFFSSHKDSGSGQYRTKMKSPGSPCASVLH